jgi:hypothetical protein
MELLSTHPIKKSDLGFNGNLFGGKINVYLKNLLKKEI